MVGHKQLLKLRKPNTTDKRAEYLLIISCSKRKKLTHEKRPAIEVYDGPIYRSLRKRFNYVSTLPVDIFIVSAKYGLITAKSMIENYDSQMTAQRAGELRDIVLSEIVKIIKGRKYKEIFVSLSSVYRLTIYGIEKYLPTDTQLLFTSGGIGRKTSQTISWLERVAFAGLNSEQIR